MCIVLDRPAVRSMEGLTPDPRARLQAQAMKDHTIRTYCLSLRHSCFHAVPNKADKSANTSEYALAQQDVQNNRTKRIPSVSLCGNQSKIGQTGTEGDTLHCFLDSAVVT